MKCVICKGDDIRSTDCGERYYDLRTMRMLEESAQKLRDNQLNLRPIGRVMEAI